MPAIYRMLVNDGCDSDPYWLRQGCPKLLKELLMEESNPNFRAHRPSGELLLPIAEKPLGAREHSTPCEIHR